MPFVVLNYIAEPGEEADGPGVMSDLYAITNEINGNLTTVNAHKNAMFKWNAPPAASQVDLGSFAADSWIYWGDPAAFCTWLSTNLPAGCLDITRIGGFSTGRIQAPNYDSGWVALVAGNGQVLNHNLGLQPVTPASNNWKCLVHCVSRDTGGAPWGVHINDIGSEGAGGFYWRDLTTNTIDVRRGGGDLNSQEVRVMIWKYE